MSDIELVIKIDEEDYKKVLESNNRNYEWNDMCACYEAVFKGTPLSKRYEKLIDTNDIKMTRTEAVNELNYFKGTLPKEPPEECDYLDEWYYLHKKLINAINMGIEALLEKQKTIIEIEKAGSEGK